MTRAQEGTGPAPSRTSKVQWRQAQFVFYVRLTFLVHLHGQCVVTSENRLRTTSIIRGDASTTMTADENTNNHLADLDAVDQEDEKENNNKAAAVYSAVLPVPSTIRGTSTFAQLVDEDDLEGVHQRTRGALFSGRTRSSSTSLTFMPLQLNATRSTFPGPKEGTSLVEQQWPDDVAAAIATIEASVDKNLYEWTQPGYCTCQGNFCPAKFAHPVEDFNTCQANCTSNAACMGFAYSGNCEYSVQHTLVDGVALGLNSGQLLSDKMNKLGKTDADDTRTRLNKSGWIPFGCLRKKPGKHRSSFVTRYRSASPLRGICGCGPSALCKTKLVVRGLASQQACEQKCDAAQGCAAYMFGSVSDAQGFNPSAPLEPKTNYIEEIAGTCRLFENTRDREGFAYPPDGVFLYREIYDNSALSPGDLSDSSKWRRRTDENGTVLVENVDEAEDFLWLGEFCMNKMDARGANATHNRGGVMANGIGSGSAVSASDDSLLEYCFYGTIIGAAALMVALVVVIFFFLQQVQHRKHSLLNKSPRRRPAAQRWRQRTKIYANAQLLEPQGDPGTALENALGTRGTAVRSAGGAASATSTYRRRGNKAPREQQSRGLVPSQRPSTVRDSTYVLTLPRIDPAPTVLLKRTAPPAVDPKFNQSLKHGAGAPEGIAEEESVTGTVLPVGRDPVLRFANRHQDRLTKTTPPPMLSPFAGGSVKNSEAAALMRPGNAEHQPQPYQFAGPGTRTPASAGPVGGATEANKLSDDGSDMANPAHIVDALASLDTEPTTYLRVAGGDDTGPPARAAKHRPETTYLRVLRKAMAAEEARANMGKITPSGPAPPPES
ncbi:unnamed protein product [Amoebophrya sp. A120]|nr:unnamed protein product [Amoebophrya sp. A120]|eukprot:GSA120T00025023001.1